MRSRVVVLVWLFAAALAFSCGTEEGAEEVPQVSGIASVPGASERLWVVANDLEGNVLGETETDADGGFDLPMTLPADGRAILVAVQPSDPDRAVFAIVEIGDPGQQPQRRSMAEAPKDVVLDAQTTAETIALGAVGLQVDMDSLRSTYGTEIAALRSEIEAANVDLCHGRMSSLSASSVRSMDHNEYISPPLISELEAEGAGMSANPTQEELLEVAHRMQGAIAAQVTSQNSGKIKPFLGGIFMLAMARMSLATYSGEELGAIKGEPFSFDDLGGAATDIANWGWGNCREKAYLAAYAAAHMPGVKQVAVVGMAMNDGLDHAFAVACSEGPEVYALSNYAVDGSSATKVPAGLVTAGCFYIDPWRETSGLMTVAEAEAAGWDFPQVVRPVILPDQPPPAAPSSGDGSCDCGGTETTVCDPFTLSGGGSSSSSSSSGGNNPRCDELCQCRAVESPVWDDLAMQDCLSHCIWAPTDRTWCEQIYGQDTPACVQYCDAYPG